MNHRRRHALALAALAATLGPLAARADDRRFAVLPLLADRFDIVHARMPTGSRLDQNVRQTFEDPQGSFDRFAALAVERAIQGTDKSQKVTLLALPRTSAYYDEPQRIFDGGKSVALPGNVVDALIAAKSTHLVLLTKHRDAARVPLADATTGVGMVRGLGFYVDGAISLRDGSTGESTTGLLAPFVCLRLTLVDVTTGEIVRERVINAMNTYIPNVKSGASNPWDVLNAEQKVAVLRRLLEKELGEAVPVLLKG